MNRLLFASLTLSLLAALFASPASAAELAQDEVPCPTGVPISQSMGCLPFESTYQLHRMLETGKFFFEEPLPAVAPDPELYQLPFYYARVNTPNAPIFASPNDAAAGKPVLKYLEGGLVYVTYNDVQEVDGKNYYMIDVGQWMRRGDISPNQLYSRFAGSEFTATPARPFGWVLEAANSEAAPFRAYLSPGLSARRSERTFSAYELIQVYDTAEANGLRWFEVGPDLWLESRQVRLVLPNTTPQEGVENGRWIEINLEQQTLAVYQDNQLVYATLVATGVPGKWTQPGLFQIYERYESTFMTGVFAADRSDYYYLEDVPWTMYFDEARALHGAYWRARFGFEQSSGCVNLSIADASWLFKWATDGDWVWVHDPSGRTPTDPSQYGSGGA
ncbi:MAG: L,D-transpeptidase [Chloroflexi bacterium]|nr:L,D-transpeptidase [Chloroflexota bacterium]